MTAAPTVSVVMAVYNGARFLQEAVISILDQTLTEFEFLIVDDASTDETPVILKELSDRDGRMLVTRNEINSGLTRSLNAALLNARGVYIARLDADDVATLDRLEKQVSFLEKNKTCNLVGGKEIVIDADGAVIRMGRGSLDFLPFRYLNQFCPPIVHSSAMFRRLKNEHAGFSYEEDNVTAQDFALWQQLLDHGEGCRLPVPVVKLREHDASISKTHRSQQAETAVSISTQALQRTCPQESEADLRALAGFVIDGYVADGVRPAAIVWTILAVERTFETLHNPTSQDRAVIRQLTVNQILKGLAKFRRRSSMRSMEVAAWLVALRPLATAREILAILSRRRAGGQHG